MSRVILNSAHMTNREFVRLNANSAETELEKITMQRLSDLIGLIDSLTVQKTITKDEVYDVADA